MLASRLGPLAGRLALLVALLACSPAGAQDAAGMRARHAAAQTRLADNPFQRPLYLNSEQSAGRIEGEIYAELDRTYEGLRSALQGIGNWCEILILHLNVKACAAVGPAGNQRLRLFVGSKSYQELADAYRFDFQYQLAASDRDYLRVVLNAPDGPLGTRDYRITLEASRLDAGRSFLHLSYSYGHGLAARLASETYLATKGRGKRGFSIVGQDGAGEPEYVGGLRGVIERNTMRYYLAVDAYLAALSLPFAQRTERRLGLWHQSVERYPLQLHELDLLPYLDMKHREIRRQGTLGAAGARASGR
ncbi:MAG: hypothetical protein Q8Q73_18885 [Stagnimonas sp.]|nr:hypothetical protein [Stagnimonas sp.]